MATLKIADLADHYTDAEAIAAVEGEATLDLTGDVTIAAAKSLAVDTIAEKTGAAGVTIDSVLLKDGVIAIGDVAFDDATSDPLIDGAAAADGTENSVARKDHVHPLHHAQSHNVASHSDTTATGAETETLTDGSDADALHDHTNHGVTHNAVHGISKHTEHANWKALYTDGSGDEQEIALGADGTVFTSTGAAGVPAFEAGGGGGAVATDVIWDAAGDLAIGTGADTAVKLPIGADHTVLVSNGTTASYSAAPPLAAIADTGDTTRITIGTASPHLTLTGDQRINGTLAINCAPVATAQIEVSPTATTATSWNGLETNPSITQTAGGNIYGVYGAVSAYLRSTGHNVKGLSFVASAFSDAAGVTITALYGAEAKASVATYPNYDMTIALYSMLKVGYSAPLAYAALTFSTYKVVDLPTTINVTDADITMPAIAYGIHLGDMIGARFNAVHLLEIGPATPYLRLLGKANPAANQTNLYLKEEATLRQVQWKDFDDLGSGDKVMVLV